MAGGLQKTSGFFAPHTATRSVRDRQTPQARFHPHRADDRRRDHRHPRRHRIGILAAIAIPNFIKFQARSKQSEAKANLKSFFTAEKSIFQEKDYYTEQIGDVGFSPERGNRYAYYASLTQVCQDRSLQGLAKPAGNETCVFVDLLKYPKAAKNPVYSGTATFGGTTGGADPGVPGLGGGTCPDCNITMTAAGQVDNETVGVDSWYVSTKDSLGQPGAAGCAIPNDPGPAGAPVNTYNDVNCD
jgi:type IV pilus assembly protein PilA